MNAWASPFIVPLGAFLVAIVAIASGAWEKVQGRRIKADQRMAMLQRGMTVEQIEQLLKPTPEEDQEVRVKDPMSSLGRARRAGMILVASGAGIIGFGLVLTAILRDREVLTVAATGLIPLAIGIGFFVDYNLQKRELARFGLEVGAETPQGQR